MRSKRRTTDCCKDSDHEVLKREVEAFPFAVAHQEIPAIIDSVLAAASPA